MGLHKLKALKARDEEADIGIGTLIIFIAIVLVAAIAASLILYAAALLQEQAERTVDDAVSEVSGGLCVVNVAGDRNPDGLSSSIVSGYMPFTDDQAPMGGILWEVAASPDGTSPLRMTINWTSANDYGSGLYEEVIYRTSVYDPTNPAPFNEQIARNRLLTLEQLNPSMELVRLDSGFGPTRQYVDYTVRDDNPTSYAYAIVGVDRAGNMLLYSPIDSSASTSGPSHDEDLTPPSGGSMTSTAIPDDYSVALFWVPASDSGSGILSQSLYRTKEVLTTVSTTVVEGRTTVMVPVTATLLGAFNSTTSSHVDAPPESGTYTYFVVALDRAGNEAFIGTLTYVADQVDSNPPANAGSVAASQAPQSILISWSEARDSETSISGYKIFRSTSMSAVDTVEELMSAAPLADLGADVRNYSDYSGIKGTLYYYAVVAVDAAGNYAQPSLPSNTIQMIEIKVKTVPGSKPILFTSLMIEITDYETDVTLYFNSALLGPLGADATRFSVEILRDPDRAFEDTFSLYGGALVKIFIDAGEAGLNLHADSSFSMKFIPTIGQPTLEECRVPYLGTYRYVILV